MSGPPRLQRRELVVGEAAQEWVWRRLRAASTPDSATNTTVMASFGEATVHEVASEPAPEPAPELPEGFAFDLPTPAQGQALSMQTEVLR